MLICDFHCDTLTKVFPGQQSLYQNNLQLDIRRVLKNGGGIQFFAIQLPYDLRFKGGIRFVLQWIDAYNREIEAMRSREVKVMPVLSRDHLQSLQKKQLLSLLSIEDGGALEGSVEVLRLFYQLGVRSLTLTWSYRNEIADGVNERITNGGLTQFGRKIVLEMNQLGMLIDLSHIAPRGFWDVLELTEKPVIASHSNAAHVCNVPRNLSDEQLKAIAQSKGVIGVNFYPKFLEPDPSQACLESIYRHIEYILNLVGEDFVAFGGDFDGMDQLPRDVAGVEVMPTLIEFLRQKGYTEPTLEKICWRNGSRILASILK